MVDNSRTQEVSDWYVQDWDAGKCDKDCKRSTAKCYRRWVGMKLEMIQSIVDAIQQACRHC